MVPDSRQRRGKKRKSGSTAKRAAERFADGDLAGAEKHCRRALKHEPSNADLWHLLAAIALGREDPDTATGALSRALAISPGNADYLNTKALMLSGQGEAAAAEAMWVELVQDSPEHSESLYNLGRLMVTAGRGEDATAYLERAIAIRPDWADAHKNLGIARFILGDNEGAEAAYSDAIRFDPRDAASYQNLAILKREADDFEAAMALFRTALELEMTSETVLRFGLLAPIFPLNTDEIAGHRVRVMENLETLESRPLALTDPAHGLGAPAFYSAYQGLNERELMARLGTVVTRAWQPPPRAPVPITQRRPRVALVSAHFKQHTIGRLYAQLIEKMPRENFDIAVLSVGRHEDALAERIRAGADHYVCSAADLAAARNALAALDADVVLHCDIGMDDISYYLASERLAPVQCASWGHPVTSRVAQCRLLLVLHVDRTRRRCGALHRATRRVAGLAHAI